MSVQKKVRAKSQVFLISALVAGILLLLNFLGARHFIRFDLTEDQEYTLSNSTKKVLSNLEDPVLIKLYFTEKVPPYLLSLKQQILDLLDEYRVYSGSKISVEHIIPESSPEKEEEAHMLGIPPLQINVIEKDKAEVRKIYWGIRLMYGDKKEIIPVAAKLENLEYDLTASILKLTAEKIPRLGLVFSEEEEKGSYKVLEKFLEKQLEVIKLSQDVEPWASQKVDALLVIKPKKVSDVFVKKITELFDLGIPLIFLAGRVEVAPNLMATAFETGLEGWFKERGLEISEDLLIDPQNPGQAAFSSGYMQYQIPYPFFVKVGKEGLNKNNPVTSKLEQVVFPWTNTITMDVDAHKEWSYEIFAESSKLSFHQEGPPDVSPTIFQHLDIKAGLKHPLVVSLEVPRENGNPSKLVLVSNATFIENQVMQDYDTNSLLVLNLVDWISWGDQFIGIRSRGQTDRPLIQMMDGTKASIRWGFMVLLPVVVMFIGLVVYLVRRRYLKLVRSGIF